MDPFQSGTGYRKSFFYTKLKCRLGAVVFSFGPSKFSVLPVRPFCYRERTRPDASKTVFSQCSEKCGWGNQTRITVCVSYGQREWKAVPESHCLGKEKPSVSTSCFKENCGPNWFTSEWLQVRARHLLGFATANNVSE